MIRRPPRLTHFPYAPLFRSHVLRRAEAAVRAAALLVDRLRPRADQPGRRRVAPDGEGGAGQRADAHGAGPGRRRSEEHTTELQSRQYLVCRLLLAKKKHLWK